MDCHSLGRISVAKSRLASSSKGFRCFLGASAAHRDQRIAVGHMQMKPPLLLRFDGLDFPILRERLEQRLRLRDLGHLRRRREPFERGDENGVSFGEASGRLVELGERQRGAQFEAARGLLLCDRDGGEEGLFRGRGIGGVACEQHFAAHPMQLRFERAVACAAGRRQRFVEDGDGAIGIARPRFDLGQRDLQEPVEQQNVLFAQQFDAAAHVLEPATERAARSGHPTLEKHAVRAKQGQVMLAREAGEFEGVRRGARCVATHQFEQSRLQSSNRERDDMGEVHDPRLHAVDKRNRAIDFAERP
jgi:hypothetical protein